MWVALKLKEEADISVFGGIATLAIKDMASGCRGCLLVFDTKEQAAEYAGPGGSIVQVEIAA